MFVSPKVEGWQRKGKDFSPGGDGWLRCLFGLFEMSALPTSANLPDLLHFPGGAGAVPKKGPEF